LSRKAAKEKCAVSYLDTLSPGDILPAKVTHLDCFGAFADIGCGVVGLLPLDSLSVSRIFHPGDRLFAGEDIRVVLKSNKDGRYYLSHKELLGTWEENAARFAQGQTAAGIVRSIESYGIFIELTPNLTGLADPTPGVNVGDSAAVYIKSILPERMKIKLAVVDTLPAPSLPPAVPEYDKFATAGLSRIDIFRYSPFVCAKVVETVF
ncbi:MAG: S1 RNA-binding domain-containing protein, partial [Clostridia bacterium]|nr:S1 RNA-binding domain-containing protein [Clostridia bacterium]